VWSCVGIGAVVEGAKFRYGVLSVPVCFWREVCCLFGVVCGLDRVRFNLWGWRVSGKLCTYVHGYVLC
jgi:hypothetical protein